MGRQPKIPLLTQEELDVLVAERLEARKPKPRQKGARKVTASYRSVEALIRPTRLLDGQ